MTVWWSSIKPFASYGTGRPPCTPDNLPFPDTPEAALWSPFFKPLPVLLRGNRDFFHGGPLVAIVGKDSRGRLVFISTRVRASSSCQRAAKRDVHCQRGGVGFLSPPSTSGQSTSGQHNSDRTDIWGAKTCAPPPARIRPYWIVKYLCPSCFDRLAENMSQRG